MSIKTAYSIKDNIKDSVTELKNQLQDVKPKMVIYFASAKYQPSELSAAMQEAFSGATVFGNTTAGEIVTGKMLKKSIVAMAFGSDAIEDVKVEVVENLKNDSAVNLKKAFSSFEKHFNTRMSDLDYKKYVGIILIDGLSLSEEKLMDNIGNLTNIFFIGGSAGDDLAFKQTNIFANGKYYTNAAVLALLKPSTQFDFIKTQSFSVLDKKLTATKVDEGARQVFEFNGKSAAEEYAGALGIKVEESANYFMSNPVGLMVDGMPYVRSPQQIKNKSMCFYCNIKEGMELSLLKSTDIINDTKKAVAEKKKELGTISGIINFHCILRTLELDQKGLSDEYGKIFADIPTLGFSTYGEEFIGHINQTSTMLVFK